jgi:hypothetical protein
MKMHAETISIRRVVVMRKLILTFSAGAIMGMATALMAKSLYACRNEMTDLFKEGFEKIKNQMQSSVKKIDFATQDALEDVIESIDSLVDETLPSKVKKTLNKVKYTLSDLM